MRAMELGEIKERKKELENKIREMLAEFQKETGTRVSILTLEIDKQYDYACSGVHSSEVIGVNLHVEI